MFQWPPRLWKGEKDAFAMGSAMRHGTAPSPVLTQSFPFFPIFDFYFFFSWVIRKREKKSFYSFFFCLKESDQKSASRVKTLDPASVLAVTLALAYSLTRRSKKLVLPSSEIISIHGKGLVAL